MSWTIDQVREELPDTMNGWLGFSPQVIEPGRCVATIEVRRDLTQPLGVLHGGAIVALADTTATYAASTVTDPDATLAAETFPLTIQMSVNLLRNTDHGTITAEARVVHGGRSTQVISTEVRDDRGRLLAVVTTTHVTMTRGTS